MSEISKVSDEKLQQLRSLQEESASLTIVLGELAFQRRLLKQEILQTEERLLQLQFVREDLVKELEGQFGSTGTVNLTTGEFVPD